MSDFSSNITNFNAFIVPYPFVDPFTLKIMEYPYTDGSTGKTWDLKTIQRAFPKFEKEIEGFAFNRDLYIRIQSFLNSNPNLLNTLNKEDEELVPYMVYSLNAQELMGLFKEKFTIYFPGRVVIYFNATDEKSGEPCVQECDIKCFKQVINKILFFIGKQLRSVTSSEEFTINTVNEKKTAFILEAENEISFKAHSLPAISIKEFFQNLYESKEKNPVCKMHKGKKIRFLQEDLDFSNYNLNDFLDLLASVAYSLKYFKDVAFGPVDQMKLDIGNNFVAISNPYSNWIIHCTRFTGADTP